jgi:predicted Zn-dependent protease
MTRSFRLTMCAAVMAGGLMAARTDAYLKLGTSAGADAISLKWRPGTITYFVSTSGPAPIALADFQAAVARGFGAWNDVQTATADFQFGGFVANDAFDEDDVNTIGFVSRPDLTRVLASTGFTYDTRNGELLEADIFFNAAMAWSTAQDGQSGRFDVQSIATHEAGHFLGLGHSALGETERLASGNRRLIAAAAVMFPIAFSPGNITERTLHADDVAGVSDIYPSSDFRRTTGSIAGHITRDGQGLFGAHVTAFNLRTRELVANFTLEDNGRYVIAGLEPGLYVVRAEPLNDGDLDSFFDGVEPDDITFAPRFHDEVVVVPAGGTADDVDINVGAR